MGFDTPHPPPQSRLKDEVFFISPLKKNDVFCGCYECNVAAMFCLAFLAFLESNYCHLCSVKKKEAPAT